MDRWQLDLYFNLQWEHGHTSRSAWLLSMHSRMEMEASLRRPLPLIIVTSC